METLIVLIIVAIAVVYLIRRYLRIFHPREETSCDCGCSGCGEVSTCDSEMKSIQPRP